MKSASNRAHLPLLLHLVSPLLNPTRTLSNMVQIKRNIPPLARALNTSPQPTRQAARHLYLARTRIPRHRCLILGKANLQSLLRRPIMRPTHTQLILPTATIPGETMPQGIPDPATRRSKTILPSPLEWLILPIQLRIPGYQWIQDIPRRPCHTRSVIIGHSQQEVGRGDARGCFYRYGGTEDYQDDTHCPVPQEDLTTKPRKPVSRFDAFVTRFLCYLTCGSPSLSLSWNSELKTDAS